MANIENTSCLELNVIEGPKKKSCYSIKMEDRDETFVGKYIYEYRKLHFRCRREERLDFT